MAIKYVCRYVHQHFPSQEPKKFAQIGIFGLKMYHLATLLGFVRRKVKWTGPFHSAPHFFSPVVERNFLAAKHKFSSCFENILFCCRIKRFPEAFFRPPLAFLP
jgi:hypothetical protein